jgi:Protein of unknown function (DUF5672)
MSCRRRGCLEQYNVQEYGTLDTLDTGGKIVKGWIQVVDLQSSDPRGSSGARQPISAGSLALPDSSAVSISHVNRILQISIDRLYPTVNDNFCSTSSYLCFYIMARSASQFWKLLSGVMAVLVLVQWFLFLSMLHEHRANRSNISSHPLDRDTFQQHESVVAQNTTKVTPIDGFVDFEAWHSKDYDGVAMTVMLKAPKWFHRRFTVMLHNAMANVPSTWPIQIFSNEAWLQKDVFPLHPGLRQLRIHPRLIWTPLPAELTKKKPKEIMKSEWLWDQVVAENVLVFSGNGAFCANSKNNLKDFLEYDYVGVPWGRHTGKGGDGSSHSFRKKSAMLRILKDHPPASEMDTPDFQYFVKYLLDDEKHYRVADRDTTFAFGGVIDPDTSPLVISGTQAHLNWTSRDALLGVCPELKVIFPSLHEPTCFGAHPNGEKCKATICALQDTLPSSGC